jgi:hypothetical protein
MNRRKKRLVALTSVAIAALVAAAACGDDDDDTAASPSTSAGAAATTSASTSGTSATGSGATGGSGATASSGAAATSAASTVAGCEHGVTDPADLSPDRQLARCEPMVLAEIAKVTNQPDTSTLTQIPSLAMDWEIRKDTTTRIQDLFIKLGVITDYTTPVPEDHIVDRSFYLKAVGAQQVRRPHAGNPGRRGCRHHGAHG